MQYGRIVYDKDVDLSKFQWEQSDFDLFQQKFDEILSFLNEDINQNNFQEVVGKFWFLVDKIPLPICLIDTNFILRSRPNYNGEVFKEEADISCNTKRRDLIKLSRFNRPFESMFYGAVPASNQARLVATVSLECCKEIVDESNFKKEQYLTFGKWYLTTTIPVLNLCFNNNCIQINSGLKNNVNNFTHSLNSKMSSERVDFIIKYYSFLSDLSCNTYSTEQQYLITTAFICTVREYYGSEFNGIIYPSSMTSMEGVNCVLTPDAVDKYLELRQAFMYKLVRNPSNPKAYVGDQASNIADVVDKKFSITTIY